jgi:perosamine synthetase
VIPVSEPLLDGREKELLARCIDTGWISSEGPFVTEFERGFSDYIGTDFGIAVCSGTAALETALYALGIGKDDEIIMPSFTIISCALAALRLGAKPVLVDIDPETWNMDVNSVESKITQKTRAIMPVHIYGHPVDMDPLFDISSRYGLRIVEDAAEAHGAEYFSQSKDRWIKCGNMSDAACFSFYANKIITTGEGGMVLTNDQTVADRAASYRDLCFKPSKRFYHTELCYNFRMSNLQAALGVAQLERIEEFVSIKRMLGQYYREKLQDVPYVRFQVEKPFARTVHWMYAIELDEESEIDAERMIGLLKERHIGARPFFIGLHAQPVFSRMGLFRGGAYPNTDRAHERGLYLPSGLALTTEQIDTVCDALQDIMGRLSHAA